MKTDPPTEPIPVLGDLEPPSGTSGDFTGNPLANAYARMLDQTPILAGLVMEHPEPWRVLGETPG